MDTHHPFSVTRFTSRSCVAMRSVHPRRHFKLTHYRDVRENNRDGALWYPIRMDLTGAYTAERAAALSGVPKSTIHWWARHEILVPSVSAERVKLWSYSDLMGLRVIYWLRQRKATNLGVDIPGTSMPAVRRALDALRDLGAPIWKLGSDHVLFVDGTGEIYLKRPDGVQNLRGPDLVRPRPDLRILPGKLGGSPHVVGTRNETCAIAALAKDDFTLDGILSLYPHLTREQIDQAIDLERQLDENLLDKVAA
jgi:uncharacterized protein (DUF433 family)/DNA-binding transcriptional MerR regulator